MNISKPMRFSSTSRFRAWLTKNHATKSDVWVLFYKKHTGKRWLSYEEAVEEALCYGWIDGQERRIDDKRHMLRFTPRRPGSTWAPSNLKRVKKLIAEKRMTRFGLEVFQKRKSSPTSVVPDRKRAA